MKQKCIAIIGGTGKVGKYIADTALERGMYSPVWQEERQVEVLNSQMLIDNGVIESAIRSVVAFAKSTCE